MYSLSCRSICQTGAGSVMNPTRHTHPSHLLHLNANTPRYTPQLRPQIAGPFSCPRGAGNYKHHLWPGCFITPSASGRLAPSPAPATASSAPRPQSSGVDACAAAVSMPLFVPEYRWRSGCRVPARFMRRNSTGDQRPLRGSRGP